MLPEYFVDGEIKVPARRKLNAALRDSLRKKKTDLDAFIASINAIIIALPEEACTRKDILKVYETVKTVSPSEISRTTIIAKKKEQAEINAELVRELQEARKLSVLEYIKRRIVGGKVHGYIVHCSVYWLYDNALLVTQLTNFLSRKERMASKPLSPYSHFWMRL